METKDDSDKVTWTYAKLGINSFDIWALGITVVIGGQYFSWNLGLVAGVGSFGIAVMIMMTGYITFIFSVSEITSGLPFTGGSYGLARCALGNYWGFVIGFSEAVEYIFYVAAAVISLETMFQEVLPKAQHYPQVTYLVIFIVCNLINLFGGKYFWRFNRILAIVCIFVVLLFVIGSFKYTDFNQYASWPSTSVNTSNPWFVGDTSLFMKVFPLAAWLFVGVESLKETCNDLDLPKVQVPRGQVSCILTLACTSILVFFVCVSLPPGIVSMSTNAIPFNAGFQLMFDLTDEDTLRYATILSIPATFATTFGFIMMYGKIIAAMSNSKFIPEFLGLRISQTGVPYVALLVGSLLSYVICLVAYYNKGFLAIIFNIAILAGFCSYTLQSICYILLKTKYETVDRSFNSPFGVYGAVVSICVWSLGIIAAAGFQDNYHALIVVCALYAIFTIWYFAYANKRQTFSTEEKAIFFKIYVINHNLKKKNSDRKLVRKRSNPSNKRSSKVIPSTCDSKYDDHSSMSEFNSQSIKTDNIASSKTDILSSKTDLFSSKKNLIVSESISEYNSAV